MFQSFELLANCGYFDESKMSVSCSRHQSKSGVHRHHPRRHSVGVSVSANHEVASGGLQVKILLASKSTLRPVHLKSFPTHPKKWEEPIISASLFCFVCRSGTQAKKTNNSNQEITISILSDCFYKTVHLNDNCTTVYCSCLLSKPHAVSSLLPTVTG